MLIAQYLLLALFLEKWQLEKKMALEFCEERQ
jgi:hypothetical protein